MYRATLAVCVLPFLITQVDFHLSLSFSVELRQHNVFGTTDATGFLVNAVLRDNALPLCDYLDIVIGNSALYVHA